MGFRRAIASYFFIMFAGLWASVPAWAVVHEPLGETCAQMLQASLKPHCWPSEWKGRQFWVIFSGHSTGADYAPALAKRGIDALHVDLEGIPSFYRGFERKLYRMGLTLNNEGQLDALAVALQSLDIRHVTSGTDRLVHLAERLGRRLGLKGNNPDTSPLRLDKGEMRKAIGGVPHIESADLKEIFSFVNRYRTWPLVIKLPQGAGGFGFQIVDKRIQLFDAVKELLGGQDNLGHLVEKVTVEPFLSGTVMAFDTVGWEGQYYVTDVLRYSLQLHRLANGRYTLLYNHADLVSPEDPVVDAMTPAGISMLRKSGHLFGAGHTEIVDTHTIPEGMPKSMYERIGPPPDPDAAPEAPKSDNDRFKLMEVNPRIVGMRLNRLIAASTGEDPIDIHIDAVQNPAKFLRERAGRRYARWKPARVVILRSQRAGMVTKAKHLEEIQALASFHGFNLKIPGGYQRVTENLQDIAGAVTLVHPSQKQIDDDTEFLRKIEPDLYELDPSVSDSPVPPLSE